MASPNAWRVSQMRPATKRHLTIAIDALRRIVRALGASARAAVHASGVTGAQAVVLAVLDQAPAQSVNDLAARTFTHQSTVSGVVERLVERGFVARVRSKTDARRIGLALTPSGRAVLRRTPRLAQTQLFYALSTLPPAELEAIARGLGTTIRTMGIATDPPVLFFDGGTPGTRSVQPPRSRLTRRKRSG
jgi:DNA-binding MarR family transcriptional regulator